MSEIRELIDQAKNGEIEAIEEQDVIPAGDEAPTFDDEVNLSEESEGDAESDASEEKQISDDEKQGADVGEQEGEVEQELEPINPPVSWPAEDKERFSTLPRELQQRIAERESQRDKDFHSNRQIIAAQDRIVKEHEPFINQYFGSSEVAMTNAMKWFEHVHTNPLDAVRELMHHANISPEMLAATARNMGPQDPYTRQLATELQTLKARDAQREAQERAYQEQQQTAQLQAVNREIEEFSNARDASGKLAHPYVTDLIEDMSVLIPHIQSKMPGASHRDVLEEAYSRAMRANPTTYKAYEQQLQQQKTRELEGRAKKANAASKSVSGSLGGSSSSAPKNLGIREAIDLARSGQLS